MSWATVVVGALALVAGAAHASPADVARCLAAKDVACARGELEGVDLAKSADPAWLYVAAETHFHAAEYAEAYALMRRAVEAGYEDKWQELPLYARSLEVQAEFTEARRGDVVVRYRPGLDAVLVEDAFATLESTRRFLDPLLSGPPPGPIVVELFPSTRSFVECSSLPESAVRETGVVALSKWGRLLAVSPRTMGRGYDWKDTLAHEYIHLVVSHHTHDRAPVWVQEAIAKYLDNRWHDGLDHFALNPRDAGRLGMALRRDALVPFEKMSPSLALLKAEEAALAYSQLASLMSFAFAERGEDFLRDLLPRIDGGNDAFVAFAAAMGDGQFNETFGRWRTWIELQGLDARELPELPVQIGASDAVAGDPVMNTRRDLANHLRLGELLAERGHFRAALVEYGKAGDADETSSPLLSNRVAQAYLGLGMHDAARASLRDNLEDYPEFTMSHKTLGAIFSSEGAVRKAADAYAQAAAFNPFDLEVQEALVELYKRLQDTTASARHARLVRILRRGGEG